MEKDLWILGISGSHNGSAALYKNDQLIVAIQEERLTRQKRQQVYASKKMLCAKYCLEYAKIQPSALDMVVTCMIRSAVDPIDDVALNSYLRTNYNNIPTESISHHFGHAISAFGLSGFDESAVLVIDGVGSPYADIEKIEQNTAVEYVRNGSEIISLYKANRQTIEPLEKHFVADGEWLSMDVTQMKKFGSLGGMYSSVASQIFGDPLEAGKVMGLAPYGTPDIPIHEFFRIDDGKIIFTNEVIKRFQTKERWPAKQEEYHSLSASVQAALEEALYYLVGRLFELYPCQTFCYSGGVALNGVANEKIISRFQLENDNVFLQPSAEDSGTAIGAAMYGYWKLTGDYPSKRLKADYVGKTYSVSDIDAALKKVPAIEIHPCDDTVKEAVHLLCQGHIIGLFHGGSELGPRALGHRSILCDPRLPDGKAILNKKVKHRERFRPFAPVILLEEADQWFETYGKNFESPFMLRVCKFKKDKADLLPAVTHVDGTGRVQTVKKDVNDLLYVLLKRFYEKTGVPVLVNTSFNIMGEPIVETPEDALWCLIGTGLDYVVFENTIIRKQPSFSSVMDLVPYMKAKRYTIHNLFKKEQLELNVNGTSFISFAVDTKWGEIKQVTGAFLLPLFERIDGRTTGRDIFHSMPLSTQKYSLEDYHACIKQWETISGTEDRIQNYTNNANVLVDDISYPRQIAYTIYRDHQPVQSENDMTRLLLRLNRSGIISFRMPS